MIDPINKSKGRRVQEDPRDLVVVAPEPAPMGGARNGIDTFKNGETGQPVYPVHHDQRVLKPHPLFPSFDGIRKRIIAEIVAPLPVIMIRGRTFYERKGLHGLEARLATIDWGDIFRRFGLEGGTTLSMVIGHERVRSIILHRLGDESSLRVITQIKLMIDASGSPSVSLEGVENVNESLIYGILARNPFINWEVTAQRHPRVFKQALYEGIADILFVPSGSERSSSGWSPTTFEALYARMADPQWVEAVKALPPARALKPGESFSWTVSFDEQYKSVKGLSVLPPSVQVSSHTVSASFTMERSADTEELIIYPTAVKKGREHSGTDKWPLVRALGNNSALDWKRTRDISEDLFDETTAVLMEHLVFEKVLELERAKGGWERGLQREVFTERIKGAPWEKDLRNHPFFRNFPLQKPFVFVFHGNLERNFADALGIERSKNGSWLAYKKTKFQIGMRITQKEPGKFEFDPPLAIGSNHHLVATTLSAPMAGYREALLSKNYSGRDGDEAFSQRFFPSLRYPTGILRAHQVAQTVLDTNDYRRLQWKAAPQFASPKETPFFLKIPRRSHQAKRHTAVHSVASVVSVNLSVEAMLPNETISLLEEI